ncbi:glycosyltransferase family 2 protein [Candidatus Poribacteria bacterium]|nr:glycosyltransferase family 2 protein [Candidatus Poribacteria bacterium]
MTPGLVSVIIPTYDRPEYLPQAVESVLTQTYSSVEIVIIDDGSEDGGATTREVLKPYLSLDSPKVTYLYQKNSGVGPAVNRGLSLAQGEYIQRLDDDDRLLPEKIARSIEVFQEQPKLGLVATGYHHIDSEGKRIHTGSPCPCPGPARLLNMLMSCVTTCAGVLVRSLVHQKVGVYRDIRAQDYEMWIRISQEYDIETIDEPLVEYRLHQGNISRNNQRNMERDRIRFISEYLQSTPLDVLIPRLQSEPHGHAIRAGVWLLKNGGYIKTTGAAKAELEKALQLLPKDPLLSLWKGVLAVCGDESLRPLPWEEDLPAVYQAKAEALSRCLREHKRLAAKKLHPSMPEMVAFRKQFGSLHSALIQETFKKAIGKGHGSKTG